MESSALDNDNKDDEVNNVLSALKARDELNKRLRKALNVAKDELRAEVRRIILGDAVNILIDSPYDPRSKDCEAKLLERRNRWHHFHREVLWRWRLDWSPKLILGSMP